LNFPAGFRNDFQSFTTLSASWIMVDFHRLYYFLAKLIFELHFANNQIMTFFLFMDYGIFLYLYGFTIL